MVTSSGIWSARRAKAAAETPAEKAERGMREYARGPHRKKAPPKPKLPAAYQFWGAPDAKPPEEWKLVDRLCKLHKVTAIYDPRLKVVALRDRALPAEMHVADERQAIRALSFILSRRG